MSKKKSVFSGLNDIEKIWEETLSDNSLIDRLIDGEFKNKKNENIRIRQPRRNERSTIRSRKFAAKNF